MGAAPVTCCVPDHNEASTDLVIPLKSDLKAVACQGLTRIPAIPLAKGAQLLDSEPELMQALSRFNLMIEACSTEHASGLLQGSVLVTESKDKVRVPPSSSHLLRQLPFTTPSLVRQIPNDRPPIGEMDVLDERIAIGNVVQLPSLLQQMGGDRRKGMAALEADDRRAEVVDLGTSEKKGPAAYPPNAGIPNERPTPPFDVVVTRSGMHWKILGVLVSPDDDARYLFVDDIWEPSLISEWNYTHPDHLQVKSGDTIISVNGSTCNGEAMLAKIQAAVQGESIRLTIQNRIVSPLHEFLLDRLNEG